MSSSDVDEGSSEEADNGSDTKRYAIHISSQEWQTIKPVKRLHTRSKLETGWTDLFTDKIATENASCVLTYKRNKVKSDNSRCRNAPFFNGLGRCKFPGCASFTFTIEDEPESEEDVEVLVTQTGKVTHEKGQVQRRLCTGQRRHDIANAVQVRGPSSVYYERLGNLSEEVYQEGNRTDVPSLTVLQKISSQLKSEEKLHEDIIHECTVAKDIWYHEDDTGGKTRGYIQGISVFPFHLVMFSSDQIKLFISNENRILHFDATGSVVKRIPGQEKKMLYYALVLPSCETGHPPIPVLELISNDQTVPTITYALSRFQHAVTKESNKIINPCRVEVDYSWALILGICHVFNYVNVRAYLIRAWNISRSCHSEQTLADLCVVHLCSAHMLKCVIQGLKKMNVTGKQKENATRCFALLQNCTSLKDAGAVYEDVCVVFSTQFETDEYELHAKSLNDKLKGLGMPIPDEQDLEGADEEEEKDEQSYQLADGIKSESPFNAFFNDIKVRVDEGIKTDEDGIGDDIDLTKNGMYNPNALKAIQMHMAMFPFWSGILLGKQEDITRATNSEVENWFRIVKYDVLSKRRYLRPGEFAMMMHRGLKGRIREFSSVTNDTWNERRKRTREPKGKKNKSLSEERWAKKSKKGKPPKYFTPMKNSPLKTRETSTSATQNKDDETAGSIDVETDHPKRPKHQTRKKGKPPKYFTPMKNSPLKTRDTSTSATQNKDDETAGSIDVETDHPKRPKHQTRKKGKPPKHFTPMKNSPLKTRDTSTSATQNKDDETAGSIDVETDHLKRPMQDSPGSVLPSPVFKRNISKSSLFRKTKEIIVESDTSNEDVKAQEGGPSNDETRFNNWKSHLRWGGSISYQNRTIRMVNTCTVDNFLMIFHCILAQKHNIVLWMTQNSSNSKVLETLLSVHLLFRSGRWCEGKALWLQQCGFTYRQSLWNAYGTESQMFVDHFADLQRTFRSSVCSDKRCPDYEKLNESTEIVLSDIDNASNDDILEQSFVQWTAAYESVCRRKKRRQNMCQGQRTICERKFTNDAPEVLLIDVSLLARLRGLKIEDIDRILKIQDKSYALFAVTICRRSHFIAKIKFPAAWYEYDGLGPANTVGTMFQGIMNYAVFVSC